MILVAVAASSVLIVSPARAAVSLETYQLTGVTFADGGTATGWFETGSDGRVYDFEISVSGGSAPGLTPFVYSKSAGSGGYPQSSTRVIFLPSFGGRYLSFTTPDLFAAAGDRTVSAVSPQSFECTNCGSVRYVNGGTLVGSPSPVEPQQITFPAAPSPAIGATWTPSATGGASGNPVTFSIDPTSTAGVCSYNGSSVTYQRAGTCVVAADQAGGPRHSAAPTVTQSLTVPKLAQALIQVAGPAGQVRVGDPAVGVRFTGGDSGNPITYSVGSATTNGACTVDGLDRDQAAVVTPRRAGTCVVDAMQAGSADYTAGSSSATFTVARGAQVVAFTSTAPTSPALGSTYSPTTTGGGSGQPVVLSVDPATTGAACSIASGVVTIDHAGTCVVAATQGGDADWEPAPPVTQAIAVGTTAQAVNLTSTAPVTPVLGSTYTPTATGGPSGNAVAFSVDPATTAEACSIDRGVVTFRHAGSCVLAADQVGNADYDAAPTVTQTIAVERNGQQLTLTSTAPASPAWGQKYVVAVTPGGSTEPVVLDVASSDAGACSIAGTTVTFGSKGTCLVRAIQAGNADYLAASPVGQKIEVVMGASPTVALALNSPRPVGKGDWYRTPVAVEVACVAGAANVVSCPTMPTVTRQGRSWVSVTAVAADGQTAGVSRMVKVDTSKPEDRLLWIKRDLPAGKDSVRRPCRGTDDVSGAASCSAVWKRTSSSWDSWRFKAVVTDRAGNTRVVRGGLGETACGQDDPRPDNCVHPRIS